MVLPPAPAPAEPTPWRVHWTDEPNDDELLRSFEDAWPLAMPVPGEEGGGWHIQPRDIVLAAFNAGADAFRVAWNDDGQREVWIHFDAAAAAA